ncbi:MAG: efflux RND transporter periplasmic adaptor subunit [Candidatus Cloacimonetes bacterium]|nr:efflux RND transporter periplasmic adaptor subunit [Candidatus Cloacimonadota bacterium]
MRTGNYLVWGLFLLVLAGCGSGNNKEARNIDQLHRENGIPVKVKLMQPEPFVKELPFTAIVTGIRQSSASAMIGGRIEKMNVKVGDYVERDSVLMEFPEDVPAAQYKQARSAYELARSTYDRMKNLYSLGGISRQELDAAETQFKVSAANWDAAQQMLKVRAPISGYITSITVRETDDVEAETVLATIAETGQMKARVWVTEDEVCMIREGMRARAVWQDVILPGQVTQVALAMDREHNAFGVDIVFNNSRNLCKSGVISDIMICTYENDNAFVLERKNVAQDEQGSYVYTVVEGSARKQYVVTGQYNDSYEILTGLAEGDLVVIAGLNLIAPGDKVMIISDAGKE